MKKLSAERREWLIAHQKRIERRRHIPRRNKQRTKSERKRYILKAPETMCLKRNYEGVAGFFQKFRENALKNPLKRKHSVDFTPIKTLSPDAALILAAELDRWRITHGLKLKPWKLNRWNSDVKRLFHEMGLFSLLKINKKEKIEKSVGDLRFFKFLTGDDSDGSIADTLMVKMSSTIGSVYNEEKLYIALSEAMTNVVQHAYPDNEDYQFEILKNQWWLAGSYNQETGKMKVMFYDQGVGIPATLPHQKFWEEIKFRIKEKNFTIDNHGYLIKAAIEIGRTRSKQAHRGKGLRQLLDFSIQNQRGKLRIISGKGDYITESDKEFCSNNNASLGGTFIQWEIKIGEATK
jgi:hypothetical protein